MLGLFLSVDYNVIKPKHFKKAIMPEPNPTESAPVTSNPNAAPANQPASTAPADAPLQPPGGGARAKFKAIVVGAIVLVVLGVGGYFAYTKSFNKAAAPTSSVEPSPSPAAAAKAQYAYIESNDKTVALYNTLTKSKTGVALTLGAGELIANASTGNNSWLQYSRDGQVLAYASTTQSTKCDVVCAVEGAQIYVKNGKATPQAVVKFAAGKILNDFALSPDGSTVYYLQTRSKAETDGYDLYKYVVQSNATTLIKEQVVSSAQPSKTPLFALADGSVHFFDSINGVVRHYSVKDGAFAAKTFTVTSTCSDCRVEYGNPLSPDGKTLVLESGTTQSKFSYYTLNLSDGSIKLRLTTPKATEQLGKVAWSPDGTSFAYDISANGGAGQNDTTLKFRVDVYDVATGKITTGPSDTSPGVSNPKFNQSWVNLLSWAPDSKSILFSNQGQVKIYQLATGSAVATDLPLSTPAPSVGYGWFTK